ncbi:MAG TPA: transporter [Candidatus Saccharimonadales bacterium]|jgi:hypothetical protein|nr:transporter [Candidatus Saccharimonadales bacterium]
MRKKRFHYFGFLLFVAIGGLRCPHSALAQQQNAEPQANIVEPIITEETMPNEPGEYDLRLSGSYLWRGGVGAGFLPRAQLFFGIANRWGGEIEVPMAFAKDATGHYGVGDISTTVKYLARKPDSRSPGIVLGLEMNFPSGSVNDGLGEGVLEAAPFIALVQTAGRFVVQGNVGYSIIHKVQETDTRNQFFYNGAVAFRLQHIRSFLLGEINGNGRAIGSQVAFSPGMKYNFTPQRYVAIALPIGLNSQTPRLGIVLQMQITLRSAEKE